LEFIDYGAFIYSGLQSITYLGTASEWEQVYVYNEDALNGAVVAFAY
jgi:hypothetical protein